MRIASVGILYQFIGPAAAEGFFHDFSGWFIFMISLGILMLEVTFLKRVFPDHIPDQRRDADSDMALQSCLEENRSSGLFRFVSPQILLILLLMGATATCAQTVSTRSRTPLTKPFSEFPDVVGDWTSKRQNLERKLLDALELNDYLLADFRNSSGEVINCYIAFNDFQSKGKASHSPESCLPSNGWELKKPDKIMMTDGSNRSIKINRAMMVMGNDRRLTYYWFDQRGRILTDLLQIKFYNFFDSIALNRTDGALVRLITPLGENESPEAADARLKDFFRQFNPTLKGFLPPGAKL
jgi:exosortase D (VPLPA-CTERM-specific)